MAVNHDVAYACGFESGSPWEAVQILTGGNPPTAMPANCTVTSLPGTPPSGTGSYCLKVDNSSTSGGITTYMPMGNARNGSLGFWWYPETNPSTVHNQIVGVDNGSLSGWFLWWRTSDQKLSIGTYDFGTTYLTSSSAYAGGGSAAWYYIQVQWRTGSLSLRIYDSTLTLNESEINVHWPTDVNYGGQALRWAQTAGNPSAGVFYIDNMYVIRNGDKWAPLNPTFAANVPNSGPGADNNTVIYMSGSSSDDSTNEYTMIDELPAGTSDYLYINSPGFSVRTQYYGHAGSLVSGTPAFITVGVTSYWQRSGTPTSTAVQSRLKDSSGTQNIPTAGFGLVIAQSGYVYYSGWWTSDSAGSDWTASEVNSNARPGHGMFHFGGSAGDLKCHQTVIYAVYGDDAVDDFTTMSHMGARVG